MSIFIGNKEIGKIDEGTENISHVYSNITQIFPDNLYSFELCYDSIGGLNGELWTLNRPLRNECSLCKNTTPIISPDQPSLGLSEYSSGVISPYPPSLTLEEINI